MTDTVQAARRVRVRMAEPTDAPRLLEMIRELAAFHDDAANVSTTVESLIHYGGGHRPLYEALIAEPAAGKPAFGYAAFTMAFSLRRGVAMMELDHLYVRQSARRLGVGRALVRAVARIAHNRQCGRLAVRVMDWNAARGFYERLGFAPAEREGLVRYVLDPAGIAELRSGSGAGSTDR